MASTSQSEKLLTAFVFIAALSVQLGETVRASLRHNNETFQRDRPSTMRIASKYNDEHPKCLMHNTVSNIAPDEGDDVENMWSWTVGKTLIISNIFAPHWGLVLEVTRPRSLERSTGRRYVAVQRVLDWSKEQGLVHPCNHAEISIHADSTSAAATAGNNKMVREMLAVDLLRKDGSSFQLRDIAQEVAKVMVSSNMAAPFSWTKNNCRDFVRQLGMSLAITHRPSDLFGFDELFGKRDYLDPELRKVCKDEASTRAHKEPCFCKSQTSWNWLHSCPKSERCTWDTETLQCHPKCAHAANQNQINCENAGWAGCKWLMGKCSSRSGIAPAEAAGAEKE